MCYILYIVTVVIKYMKRSKIFLILAASAASLFVFLLLPSISKSGNFVAKAQVCGSVAGGRCVPKDYKCAGGYLSPTAACHDPAYKCYVDGRCIAPTGPTAGCPYGSINTALGCFNIGTPNIFVIYLLRAGIGVGGGIAFLLMVYAGFMIMTSSGDPRRLAAGKELLTAAISGLLFLVGGTYVLRLIGVDLLGIF
jgi:hypothetical protein